MRWLAIAIVGLLAISSMPASTAGGGSDHHWNGYVLDRSSIANHVLINQNYDYYSLHTGNHDAIVVAFIFTTCPDVCPVITSNMKQAAEKLDGVDYQFISITVDPGTDSPQVLREYMNDYDVTWPHLTGELEDLEKVWGDFGIAVNTEEIENHDHDHSHDHADKDEDGDEDSSVVVVMPDGTASSYELMPSGWNQLTASAYHNGWDIDTSNSTLGNFVSVINNDSAPSDDSWWWELHVWNESTTTWEAATADIDSIEAGQLAFAPNNADDSTIPVPQTENETFVILQSDGTSDSAVLDGINAWHMSLAALDSFDAPTSELGHYMNAIDGIETPSDSSWVWELHYWDEESSAWISSDVGMDSLVGKEHIAWAPNVTEDIPAPDSKMVHKLGIVFPDGTTEMFDGDYLGMNMDVTAMEHTMKTFNQNEIPFIADGEGITSINNSNSEYDLYIWHNMGSFSHWMATSDTANESILMDDSDHYAWVGDGQDASLLQSPDKEPKKNETSTSHSTQTFILDGDWKPKVVFLGYDWDVDLFVEDVERAAKSTSDPDGNGLPGFTIATFAASIGLALIATSRDE